MIEAPTTSRRIRTSTAAIRSLKPAGGGFKANFMMPNVVDANMKKWTDILNDCSAKLCDSAWSVEGATFDRDPLPVPLSTVKRSPRSAEST